MEHYELVQEMGSVERMNTQERLKHARKRRTQQLKKYAQYERQLDKDSNKKKKTQDKQLPSRKVKKNRGNVKFVPNIALLEAAARNDLSEVKMLLESGVSPNVTNEDGLTALHQCCIDNSEEMMKLLLDFNANVNACDSEMWTPLHAAATCGHMMLCKYLIDRGAELLAVNADGNMPYDICEDEVTLDHIETEMAKKGITQEQIDLIRQAGEYKMLDEVKEFVSKGGDLEMVDNMGATLLHIAAANGYVEVVEFLLDNHVCVDVQDKESWQPVHASAYWAQQEILELLVESGADLDAKTKNGETPFDLCEDPDLKQKILDMKDEIETKRSIRQQRLGSQRKQRVSSRNASMRRSSMRGDKSQLFKKEHKEEALHFGLNLVNEDESLVEAEEEHVTALSTDIDQVTVVVVTSEGDDCTVPTPPQSAPSPPIHHDVTDAIRPFPPLSTTTTITTTTSTTTKPSPPPPKPTITIITVGSQPVVRPRSQDPLASVQPVQRSEPTVPTVDSQKQPPPAQTSSAQAQSITPPSSPPKIAQKQTKPRAAGQGRPYTDLNSSSVPVPRSTPFVPQALPQQAAYPAPAPSEHRSSGPTLSDLKRQRSNSRESLLDLAVQSMFLESVQSGRQSGSSVAARGKARNGLHNNNNNNSNAMHYSAANDGQLHRFVAPTSSPVVGGDDEKQKCCVIL